MFSAEELSRYSSSTPDEGFQFMDVIRYPVSSAIDLANTLTNSLAEVATFGLWDSENNTTDQWLKSIDKYTELGVSDFYEENQTLVNMTSFVGGIFVPGMAVSRGIKYAQSSGSILPKAFKSLERAKQLNHQKVIQSFKTTGAQTAEYNAAMKALRNSSLKQSFAENIGMELAFATYMNGHAYMEDGYDVGDFAIGVAFGAAFAPLSAIAETRKAKDVLLGLQKDMNRASEGAIAISFGTESPGHLVTGKSLAYNEALRAVNAPGLNTETIDNIGKLKVRTLVEIKHDLLGMADEAVAGKEGKDFKISNPEGVHKAVVEGMEYPAHDIFEASPGNILTKMAVQKPGVFNGVSKFTKFNIDELVDHQFIDNTYITHGQGEVTTLDNRVFLEAVSPSWDWEAAKKLSRPTSDFPGVTVKTGNDRGRLVTIIDVPNSKTVNNKQFKEWVARELSDRSYDGIPVVMRSADGHLKGISSAKTTSRIKGVLTDLQQKISGVRGVSSGKLVMPKDVDPHVPAEMTDFAMVIPYHGENVISGHYGQLALPAAGDPYVVINPKARAQTTKWKYDPTVNNTQTTDGQFLQAKYIFENDKTGELLKETIDVTDIPRFQYAILAASRGQKIGTKVKTTIGDLLPEDALEVLLKQKAGVAQKIISNGGMYEQAALATNLGVSDIKAMHAGQWSITDEVLKNLDSWATYVQKPAEVYHKAEPIRILGRHRTAGQMDMIRQKQALDLDTMRTVHSAIIREAIDLNQSTNLGEIVDEIIETDGWRMLNSSYDTMSTTVERNNRLFTSADQAMRAQGQVGDIIAHKGKVFQELVNGQLKKMATSLSSSMKAVASSRTDVLQYEQIRRATQAFTDDGARLEVVGDKIKIIGGVNNGQNLKYIEGGEISLTTNVQDFLNSYSSVADEFLRDHNALRRIDNMPALPNRGLWFPYEAVEDKFIAFKVNKKDPNDIFIITGNSANDLQAQLDVARKGTDNDMFDFVTRDQIGYWSDLLDTATLNPLMRADSTYKKSGIALHTPRTDAGGLDELMGQLSSMRWRLSRMALRKAGTEVFDKLEKTTAIHDELFKSSAGKLSQRLGKGTPTSEIAYKTLMNTSSMERYPILQMANNGTTAKINQALTQMRNLWDSTGLNRGITPEGFEELGKQAEALGIPRPWDTFEEFLAARGESKINKMAEERIAQMNGLSTLFNLRLLDWAHAAITVLSTPVILSGQMKHAGVPLKEFMQTAKWMMKGGQEYKDVMKYAMDRNLIKSSVSETSDLFRRMHTTEKKWAENLRELGNKLSFASDWSEVATREFSYAMGYRIAKAKGITSTDLRHAYADVFVTRAMGNYVSRQRPTLFQGSLGSVIGLYQTFMVTMGQNIYRYVESADYKAMGYLLGAQSAMFGFESLPMYHPFNRMLGEYMSDENENITTQTYQAMGQDAAEFALYGVPSYVFQTGLFTRAELQPRSPLSFDEGASFNPASLNNVMQGLGFLTETASSLAGSIVNDGSVGDWTHATLQGVAAQSIWRPGARWAELAMGRSYDAKGELISSEEDVYGFPILARVFASRPLKETILRQAKFNAGYYEAADKASRQKVISQIRRMAADGEGIGASAIPLMNEYLQEGGTAQGWRDVVKQSYMEANTPFAARVQKDIKQQEGWVELLEDYK